ncbi:MAG: helix-turn-helix transcriptional regulator [Oscillospiraceae bacterium]|nr:helix-turn-helix transcriptional regulator [Oscillospiraceae bacterium]
MIYGLYEKIKNLRVHSGMSQVQLAERLGITKSAVNAWESGTNSPSLSYIIRLAQVFGVSTDYLLGVNERLTVDITNLDELQKQAVTLMIKLFERDNEAIADKNKAP